MAVNVIVHIILGLLGTEIFTLSIVGVIYCFGFVAFTQAAETYRQYSEELKKMKEVVAKKEQEEAGKAQKKLYQEMLQTFGENFFLAACIVLFAAEVGRMGGF